MGNGTSGSSGTLNIFHLTYEVRKIVVAQGIDFRDEDIRNRQTQGYSEQTLPDFLQNKFSDNFQLIDPMHARYISDDQKVCFEIEITQSKEEFKRALNTPGIHVIYSGHARYGRGSCFDPEVPNSNYEQGERWEHGETARNGLYRLAYPFVPVPYNDIEHHHYHFAPLAGEARIPPSAARHPAARRNLSRKTLPQSLRGLVIPEFESTSNTYWGYGSGNNTHILLHAGWENTRNDPFDLGATELRCKCFCHFGCSSKLHYWRIVRASNYKNWVRDNPPTDRFAYFTTAPADYRVWCYWLFYLMKYSVVNNYQSWWNSLQYAKVQANRLLSSERAGFQIY